MAPSALARLDALCSDARKRARAAGRGLLVSVVEPVRAIDGLAALEALAGAAEGRALAGATADRMYWTRPADGFSLAAFGSVAVLTAAGATRFATIDGAWRALCDGAIVDDKSEGAAGAGPLLIGGFAFDEEPLPNAGWRDFPAARMVVPRIQLASADGAHWLTTNVMVASSGEPDVDLAALIALRDVVTGASAPNGKAPASSSATASTALTYEDARTPAAWRASVVAAVAEIRAGALEKVVLAREVRATAPGDFDIAATLRHLRSANRSSFVFGCWRPGSAFIGASPELLVRNEVRDISASSLAGSVSRGRTADEDAVLAARLLGSAKDRIEHDIVRRELREGMAEFCDDVVADDEPSLLTLPQVHHLNTDVRGRLRPDHSLLELLGRLHPTPAVGGAPRAAALEFIREHEQLQRGWYAGPIGWLQRERGEFAVALRSALVTANEALLFAGCGIVGDSDPDEEFAESLLKLRPMEMALSQSVIAENERATVKPAPMSSSGPSAR